MIYSLESLPPVVLTEAEIFDTATSTVTNIQTTFGVGEAARDLTGASAAFVRTVYASAALSVYQSLSRTWETVVAPRTMQDIDYQVIEDRYGQLGSAVSELSKLDENDDRFIDQETAEGGSEVLHWLSLANVPAPTIFTHGGDSLVFTWDLGETKRYLTPIDGIARVREYSKEDAGKLVDSHNFDLRDGAQTVRLLKLVGGTKWKIVRQY